MTLNNSESDFEKAKECAFWYINRRRYTKRQLTEKLVSRNYDRDLAAEVADHLEERGYIDDRDFVIRYIHDAVNIKKHGAVRIKNDLLMKGIDRNIIDEMISKSDVDYYAVLDDLISSKASSLDLCDEKQKNKLVSFLVRRGFSYGDIFDALKNYSNNKGEV